MNKIIIISLGFILGVMTVLVATNIYLKIKIANQVPIIIETESKVPYHYSGEYMLTWYCSGTHTASGNKVNHELTVAADLKEFNFNDVLFIESIGKPVVVHDTGKLVKGKRLDVYVDNCDLAKQNGVKYSKVYKIEG